MPPTTPDRFRPRRSRLIGTTISSISLKPKKHGGPEVRVDTNFEVAWVLAKGDGSAAWVWTIMGVHDLFMALFPEKAQHEYWANDRTLSASSFAPFGRVTEVQGGLKLNGKDFRSRCR